MRLSKLHMRMPVATSVALAIAAASLAAPVPAAAATSASAGALVLSKGKGRLVSLSQPISDVFVADDKVADVQVRSATQIYIFGKGEGETTVHATSRSGAIVYATSVRVGNNVDSLAQMLTLAMPEADIQTTPMNGLVLLTGTVPNPEDGAEAERLVQAFVGEGTQVVSRLRSATPLQVNLQVRIAEVSRDLAKNIGVNLTSADPTGGFLFGVAQGRANAVDLSNLDFTGSGRGTTLAAITSLFGLDVGAAIDLAEVEGMITILANPNLTALSGETASFLAGGEIPIPISQALGTISVEYKQYGVSLAFTPTVLADGRISMRVRPEVSQLSTAGQVTLNNFVIPGLTTRRAETTIELGSGQSFMIGGLLSQSQNNAVDKAPFLGDLPIIGALFRSNNFRRQESELMIIVTPYLVKPVSTKLALPTDGYLTPTDAQRLLLGQSFEGESGVARPAPRSAPGATQAPSGSAQAKPAPKQQQQAGRGKGASPAPGFSIN